MTTKVDYTSPTAQFTYDINTNRLFTKNAQNYVNLLSVNQLNTLDNVSMLDIFLSTGNIVEPHYHQNAAELIYIASGAAVVSIINPFTNQLMHFPITPGQVANVPQGWWHYEIATVDNTHLLAIFNAPVPEVIFGSDILRLTPTNILAYTYCLNEPQLKEVLAPLTKEVFLGPPSECQPNQVVGSPRGTQQPYPQLAQQQPQPQHRAYGYPQPQYRSRPYPVPLHSHQPGV